MGVATSHVTPLKLWRVGRGYTQAQLARRLGLSQQYISDIEVGRRVPTDRWLVWAARKLKIPPRVLL